MRNHDKRKSCRVGGHFRVARGGSELEDIEAGYFNCLLVRRGISGIPDQWLIHVSERHASCRALWGKTAERHPNFVRRGDGVILSHCLEV
jgi:hypothetical protein